jgi:DnaJ like chaperone protein
MSWIGKVGGGVLGFVAAGPVGAAIGLLLGHQYDRGLLPGPRAAASYDGLDASPDSRQRVFFETTFLVMGHLAKVDGRVSEAEIQAARLVMRQMRLQPVEVRRAIELFNSGKEANFPVDAQVERLRRAAGVQPELLRVFLELQMDLALAKGAITSPERELLTRIADRLGVGRIELAHMEAMLRSRRSFRQRAGRPQDSLEKAYEVIGVPATASDQEVKTAYRRLMNQHHPDKQMARGLPESMLEIAKERTREILAAYEVIRERRGIR